MTKVRIPIVILFITIIVGLIIIGNGHLSYGGYKGMLENSFNIFYNKEEIALRGNITLSYEDTSFEIQENSKLNLTDENINSSVPIYFEGTLNKENETIDIKFFLENMYEKNMIELGSYHKKLSDIYMELPTGEHIDLNNKKLNVANTNVVDWKVWIKEQYNEGLVNINTIIVDDPRTGYEHLKVKMTCYTIDFLELIGGEVEIPFIKYLESGNVENLKAMIYLDGLGEISNIVIIGILEQVRFKMTVILEK